MVRQIIIPTTNNFTIHLPNQMLGKAIEVTAVEVTDILNVDDTIADNTTGIYNNAIQFLNNIL